MNVREFAGKNIIFYFNTEKCPFVHMADERAHGNGKTPLQTSGPICVQIGKWPSGQKSFRRRTENEVHHIEHLQFHTLDSNTCTQSNTYTHKYTYTPHRHQPYHTLCRLWCVFTYDFGHRTTVVLRTTSIDRNESHCLGVHRASHTHRRAHTHTHTRVRVHSNLESRMVQPSWNLSTCPVASKWKTRENFAVSKNDALPQSIEWISNDKQMIVLWPCILCLLLQCESHKPAMT